MEDALTRAVIRLRAAGCVFAEEEAAILREAAPTEAVLDDLVERRAAGEPLEQVVGHADFCGLRVHLRPGVFVPRVRSALLVRLAVEAAKPGAVLVDLCCGSGALGLAARRSVDVTLHGADLDPVAVDCARDNYRRHGLDPGDVHRGDLYTALPGALRGTVDVLIANVPYVATRHIPFLPAEARDHEPREALDGGADGLDLFRRVAAGAPDWLAPGGLLLSEITEAQEETAVRIVTGNGLTATVLQDDDLDARAIVTRRTHP
ncbi:MULTISPECIES: putative protein N(5)-glutamine methyltransferase [Actinoplanes]|uniref:putative protein N(5)-glutamine methyltransferase n=1 Tax=Actinoplanes TaxID=1865 RepID=UPI0005F2E61A|nr:MULTISPECIES: putative protein N(5)-glutamine methyltransferase [Actinoplanes]GLY01486.1 N5-glutamine S-adenosyl-L-methionine-dependent methyltransferase [Actinoplanes sp. NBRC 101535]